MRALLILALLVGPALAQVDDFPPGPRGLRDPFGMRQKALEQRMEMEARAAQRLREIEAERAARAAEEEAKARENIEKKPTDD